MAQPKARLYQRLRTKGFPWVLCDTAKNGSPKPHADAFQFGVRYSLNGKRQLDTAATLDEALAILKDRNVRLYANQNGVALPGAHGEASAPRLTIAEAAEQYFSDKAASSPRRPRYFDSAVSGFASVLVGSSGKKTPPQLTRASDTKPLTNT
jgi:hypothetical protein